MIDFILPFCVLLLSWAVITLANKVDRLEERIDQVRDIEAEKRPDTSPSSALNEQVSQQEYATAPPLQDQGGGELRIVRMLNEEADDAETVARWLEGNPHNARKQKNCRERAALYRQTAALFNEDPGEPLTQSEAGGVQACPDCESSTTPCSEVKKFCPQCHRYWTEDELKRRERSGSGND